MTDKQVYTIDEAAEAYGVSVSTLRRAAHSTDPDAFPPPIKAKRKGKGEKAGLSFHRTALDAWFEAWPDAS